MLVESFGFGGKAMHQGANAKDALGGTEAVRDAAAPCVSEQASTMYLAWPCNPDLRWRGNEEMIHRYTYNNAGVRGSMHTLREDLLHL